jgi:hypothetical protein
MPLDQKQLRADAKRLHRARSSTSGKGITGTTSAIRAALPAIRDLREGGVAWAAIAEALAEQGVVQGKDRIPLTERRLTALVSQIEAQDRRKLESRALPRSDTTPLQEETQLSLKLNGLPNAVSPAVDGLDTEHQLRAAAFAKLQQSLFKKD